MEAIHIRRCLIIEKSSKRPSFMFSRMGRVKLKIKRLENTSNRQVTYSKRRTGILKKARELSILCDIDIVLLMFAPTGRPTLFHGNRSNIEEVIHKFAQLTPQERTKRKLESLEALKKTFKKLDHDVNIQDFLGTTNPTVEGLTDQIGVLQVQLSEIHRRLSFWENIDKIDNIDQLRQLEESLGQSITSIRIHKENIKKNQLMSLECASQYQNAMSLPMMMGSVPEAHSMSWLSDCNDNQQLIMPTESTFLSNREMECVRDGTLPGYSGFFVTGKPEEIGNPELVDNISQDSRALNELSTTGCISLQLGDEYPCPYSSFGIQEERKLKNEIEMDLQANSSLFQANADFELPRPQYDSTHHAWIPGSNSCSMPMFGDSSYQQQPN